MKADKPVLLKLGPALFRYTTIRKPLLPWCFG